MFSRQAIISEWPDDFRFDRRMPSRAAAIRELLRRGLTAAGFDTAAAGMKSQSFGVLGSDTSDERMR